MSLVVIARFADARRARRMRAWLLRSHIRSRLDDGVDGWLELRVHPRDEHRALDLMVTLVYGLDIDHIPPEPATERAMTLENGLLGGAIALVTAMLALVAWWVVPVLSVVPIGTIGIVVAVVFVLVAAYPGRTVLARDPFRSRR